MAGRGQGLTSLQSVGALLGFPALASALSPAGPAVTIPGDVAPPAREVRFPRTLPRVPRKALSVMFTQGPSLWPCSLLEAPLRVFSLQNAKEKFSCSQVGEVTTHRRRQVGTAATGRIGGMGGVGGGRRRVMWLAEARSPSWQTICKYLLRVGPGPALWPDLPGTQRCPV